MDTSFQDRRQDSSHYQSTSSSLYGVSSEDDDTDTTTSPKRPTFRPDLNREEQLASYNLYKWHLHSQYTERMQREQSEHTPQYKKVAIQFLLDEAHALHQERKPRNEQCPEKRKKWCNIATHAMRDLRTSGSQSVIRNLSCMCIFVGGHQADSYGEHELDRTRRITQQCDTLNKLHMQRAQGDTGAFLKQGGRL